MERSPGAGGPVSAVQSVELLLDPLADALVTDLWRRLLDAELPSQARHRSPSNRPHVTLVARPGLPEGAERRLAAAAAGLPVEGTWGTLTAFGRGPWTLVWLVSPSPAMLALHSRVAEVCEVPSDHLTAPAHWTPHVTLARRVREADLPAALALLDEPVRAVAGRLMATSAVRRWDAGAKVEWLVAEAGRGGSGQP